MMGSLKLRLVPLAATAALFAACTVGPRTPIESPSEAEPQAPSNEENKKEDDFVLPKAERVTDDDSAAPSREISNEPGRTHTEVGKARVWIGSRPPWAKIDALPVSTAEKAAALGTQWRLAQSILVGHGYLHQADFTPDAQSVLTLSNQTGELYHYDLKGKLLRKVALEHFKEFDAAAFSVMREITARPQVLVTRPSGTSVLDLESGRFDFLKDAPAGDGVEHAGRQGLYGVSHRDTEPQSGRLVLQWITGEVAAELICADRPDGWALSNDGRTLAVSYYPSSNVEIIDLENMKLIGTLPLPQWGSSVDISPDGALLAMGGEKLQVVRLSDLKIVGEDTKYGNNIDTVRFTPQGDLLLASAYDGKARSYALPADLSTLTALPQPQNLAHSGSANVYALGLTADGRNLVTSSGDKTIKIWKR